MKMNKMLKTMCVIVTVFSAFGVRAQIVNPEFPFSYLGKNQVCPGMQARLHNVGTVGATRSDGCCGTDEIWSPGVQVQHGIEIRSLGFFNDFPINLPELQFLTPDIFGDIARHVPSLDFSRFPLDKSIVPVIHPVISVMEQLQLRNATIEMCMNRADINNLYQNKTEGTVVQYNLGYDVYVDIDTVNGRERFLVQQIAGDIQTNTGFFHLYYDFVPRTQIIFDESWPNAVGKYGSFQPVENETAKANLDAIKAELGGLLGL